MTANRAERSFLDGDTAGPGIKTALFGGEGLFFATLTGPGKVWIQSLPFSRLASRVMAAAGGRREAWSSAAGGRLLRPAVAAR